MMDAEPIEVPEVEKPKRGLPVGDPYTPIPEQPRRRRRGPWFFLVGCLLSCCACCALPFCVVGIGAAILAPIAQENKATDSGTERVELSQLDGGPVTLKVDNRTGSIVVRGDKDADAVTVEYTRTAYALDQSNAERQLQQMPVNVEPDGDTVLVTVEYPSDNPGSFIDDIAGWFSYTNLTITVPEAIYLDISMTAGSVEIEDIHALGLDISGSWSEVRFTGTLDESGDYSISSSSYIEVTLPADSYVALDAESGAGDVNVSGFEVRDQRTNSTNPGKRWTGTLGTGQGGPPTLKLRTEVGEIRVQAG